MMPTATAYGAAHPRLASAPASSSTRRWIALAVALAAGGVLALAAWLEPAGQGLGTHQRLGMPPCGWIALMDLPCPTCGMTTSFAHAANGNLLASIVTQPMGCLLALATAMTLLVSLHTAATGSRLPAMLGRLWGRRTGWGLVALVLLAWGYKILSYRGVLG